MAGEREERRGPRQGLYTDSGLGVPFFLRSNTNQTGGFKEKERMERQGLKCWLWMSYHRHGAVETLFIRWAIKTLSISSHSYPQMRPSYGIETPSTFNLQPSTDDINVCGLQLTRPCDCDYVEWMQFSQTRPNPSKVIQYYPIVSGLQQSKSTSLCLSQKRADSTWGRLGGLINWICNRIAPADVETQKYIF